MSEDAVPAGGPLARRAEVDRALAGLLGRDALYVVLWAVQVMVAALVTPVVTRVMDAGQFGQVATANAVMQVLFVLGSVGLATGIQRQHARGDADGAHRLFSVAVLGAFVVTVLAHLTGGWWSSWLGLGAYGPVLQLAVLWAGTTAVTSSSLALLRSHDQLLRFAVLSLVQSVVAEVAALTLVAAFRRPGAELFLLGQVGAQVIAMFLGLAYVSPRAPRRTDLGMVLDGLRFSLPLVPTALSSFVLGMADRLIIRSLLGAGFVGGYQVAYNIGAMPMLLLSVLNTSWLPRLFGLTADRAAVLGASRVAVSRLVSPVVLGLCIGGPVVLRVWVPPSYDPDALAGTFAIIVVTLIPYAAGAAATRTLVTAGRTGIVAWCNIGAAVLNVVLNVVLVPRLQLVGAAAATFLAFGALWLSLIGPAARAVRVPAPPWRLNAGLCLSGAVGVLSAAVPIGGGFIVLRLLLGVLALVWLAVEARRLNRSAELERS